MASVTSFLPPNGFSTVKSRTTRSVKGGNRGSPGSITAQRRQQQQQQEQRQQQQVAEKEREENQANIINPRQQQQQAPPQPQPRTTQQQPTQPFAKSKNMTREYGSQWLSSVTRHVRIYAAYIDPVTHAFDQTQTDKLTLILDPSNEFVWTPESCQKVYAYFQELVDHYEGAPLSEYTLRLIGSDVEHYIRKLLYDGEINYNMNARMLNFSMGKPRLKFNSNQIPGVQ